jgi:hypothetical protein
MPVDEEVFHVPALEQLSPQHCHGLLCLGLQERR